MKQGRAFDIAKQVRDCADLAIAELKVDRRPDVVVNGLALRVLNVLGPFCDLGDGVWVDAEKEKVATKVAAANGFCDEVPECARPDGLVRVFERVGSRSRELRPLMSAAELSQAISCAIARLSDKDLPSGEVFELLLAHLKLLLATEIAYANKVGESVAIG